MRHCDATTIMICKFACVFKFISPKTCLSPTTTTTFLTTKERLCKNKNFLILLWRSLGCIFPLKILYRIYFISRGRWYHPWDIVVVLKLHLEFFSIAHLSKFLHSDNHTNSINLFFISVLIILHFPLWKDCLVLFKFVVYYPKTTYVLRVIKFTCRYNDM